MAAFARHKRIPVHSQSFWYYWGGISLFLFLIQIFTGILLLVYYRPGAEAFESVRQITYVMHFGWLIRSAHSWSANLILFAILVHMFSVYFMKAYRKPREVGWFTGMALLFLAAVFGFSGYLLPMDELSYYATKVGLQIPASIPFMGAFTTTMLRGGAGGQRLHRAALLRAPRRHPAAVFLPLLGLHLYLVQKHGNAIPPCEEAKHRSDRKSIPFFPNFFRRIWPCGSSRSTSSRCSRPSSRGLSASRLTRSCPRPPAFIPSGTSWPIPDAQDPRQLRSRAQGEIVGMLLFTPGLALWVLIPFYDKTESGRRGRNAHYFGLFAVILLLSTTALGYWTIRQ